MHFMARSSKCLRGPIRASHTRRACLCQPSRGTRPDHHHLSTMTWVTDHVVINKSIIRKQEASPDKAEFERLSQGRWIKWESSPSSERKTVAWGTGTISWVVPKRQLEACSKPPGRCYYTENKAPKASGPASLKGRSCGAGFRTVRKRQQLAGNDGQWWF